MKPLNNEQKFLTLVSQGLFEIDNQGRIWRLCGGKNMKNDKRFKQTPCIRAERILPNGYYQVRTLLNGVRYHLYSHRIIYTYFKGTILNGLSIDHINGCKTDNRPENLEPVTHKENKRRARNNIKGHLTEKDVSKIRKRYDSGESVKSFYREYNAGYQAINNAAQRITWRGVMPTCP